MTRHDSERVVGRITRKGTWDRRFVNRPSVEDTRIPPVRILNYYLAMVALWVVLIGWVVSNFMEGGA